MQKSCEQPPFVRIAVYRVVRALAGCGRHCATLFTQQRNGFNRFETESLSAFDLQVTPFSFAFLYSGIAIFQCLFSWRGPSRGVRTT